MLAPHNSTSRASQPSPHGRCASSSRLSSSWWIVPRRSTIMAAKGMFRSGNMLAPSRLPHLLLSDLVIAHPPPSVENQRISQLKV